MMDFLRKLFGCDAEKEENKRCEEEQRRLEKKQKSLEEKQRRREEVQKQREEEQRRYNEEWERATKALEVLGLIETDEDEENDGELEPAEEERYYDYVEYNSSYDVNEYLDFDRLVKIIGKQKVDIIPKVRIKSSSGKCVTFWLNCDLKCGAIKEEGHKLKIFKSIKALRNYVTCICGNEQIKNRDKHLSNILADGVNMAMSLTANAQDNETFFKEILLASDYYGLIKPRAIVFIDRGIACIEYEIPSQDDISWVRKYKFNSADNVITEDIMPESVQRKTYENLIYSVCLRSIYEISVSNRSKDIATIVFNGNVSVMNKASGLIERKCILSLQVEKDKFLQLDLTNVDPKICFKSLHGVSASRLTDVSPVQPVMTFNKNDKRFVQSKDVQIESGTNVAAMDWEEFEHLVREIFELEFSKNGGEVHVTQTSRDGGVDAIVFDPDPLRGGKIIIQAKRYTNTVGVSAVRDLYGTVINEGANSGILITTSDFGHDSYDFAKDKPLKLLNGGHLLALLHKNGKEGYIDIQEAKDSLKS